MASWTRAEYLDALAELRQRMATANARGDVARVVETDKAVRALARALDAAFPPETKPGPVALGGRLP